MPSKVAELIAARLAARPPKTPPTPLAPPAPKASEADKTLAALMERAGVGSVEELTQALEDNAPVIEKWKTRMDGLTPAARKAIQREKELEARLAAVEKASQEKESRAVREAAKQDALGAFKGALKPGWALAAALEDGILRFDEDAGKYIPYGADGKPTGQTLKETAATFLKTNAALAAAPGNVGGPNIPRGTAPLANPAEELDKTDRNTRAGRQKMWGILTTHSPEFQAAVQEVLPPRLRKPATETPAA